MASSAMTAIKWILRLGGGGLVGAGAGWIWGNEEKIAYAFMWLMNQILLQMPVGWQVNISSLVMYLEFANDVVPITFGLGIFMAYMAWLTVFNIVKFVRRCIPTAG
jgi:hypothetical protein